MTYFYTHISQYLGCPRRYRHRYIDGWREKDTRAAMLFGRAFEHAVAARFRREDPAAVLFEQWGVCKNMGLTYAGNDTWPLLCTQGAQTGLCNRVAQTRASVPCSRPRPMPTLAATLVAAWPGQRPNTQPAWQAFAHPRILGEQTRNINSAFLCVRRVRSQYCLVGYQATQSRCATADSGATITAVRKQPAGFRRRKLSAVVRKAITGLPSRSMCHPSFRCPRYRCRYFDPSLP